MTLDKVLKGFKFFINKFNDELCIYFLKLNKTSIIYLEDIYNFCNFYNLYYTELMQYYNSLQKVLKESLDEFIYLNKITDSNELVDLKQLDFTKKIIDFKQEEVDIKVILKTIIILTDEIIKKLYYKSFNREESLVKFLYLCDKLYSNELINIKSIIKKIIILTNKRLKNLIYNSINIKENDYTNDLKIDDSIFTYEETLSKQDNVQKIVYKDNLGNVYKIEYINNKDEYLKIVYFDKEYRLENHISRKGKLGLTFPDNYNTCGIFVNCKICESIAKLKKCERLLKKDRCIVMTNVGLDICNVNDFVNNFKVMGLKKSYFLYNDYYYNGRVFDENYHISEIKLREIYNMCMSSKANFREVMVCISNLFDNHNFYNIRIDNKEFEDFDVSCILIEFSNKFLIIYKNDSDFKWGYVFGEKYKCINVS